MKSKDRSGRESAAAADSRQSTGAGTGQRQSARQERLGERRRRREQGGRYSTASSRTGPGGLLDRVNPIVMWTVVAAVAAVVLIGAVLIVNQPQSYSASDFHSPLAITPTTIPANGHTLGDATAPVTVDLYSDFRCSGCGFFYSGQEPKIIENYVATGKVKLVYHDYTLIDMMQSTSTKTVTASLAAANAGLCAADQNAFWKYHDWLFSNQSSTEDPAAFSIDRLIGMAKAAGIDNATFESCVKDGKHNADVAAEMKAAPSSINSTPTVYVNDKLITSSLGPGYQASYTEIAAAIDAALQTASPSAS
jgi:protein-disulfide isomerase